MGGAAEEVHPGLVHHRDKIVQQSYAESPRQGKARQGKARQGKARQGKARQGKARQGKAILFNVLYKRNTLKEQ